MDVILPCTVARANYYSFNGIHTLIFRRIDNDAQRGAIPWGRTKKGGKGKEDGRTKEGKEGTEKGGI